MKFGVRTPEEIDEMLREDGYFGKLRQIRKAEGG
jgi:hypothetical protein